VVRRYAFIKYDFQGGQVWIETGVMIRTTDFWHFVPVYDIVTAILKVLCDILPSVHALTGCDCTSAFFNIGKMLVYMLVRNNANRYKDLIKLGELSEGDSISPSGNLTSHLYDGNRNDALPNNLNKLRVNLPTTKHTELTKVSLCIQKESGTIEMGGVLLANMDVLHNVTCA